MEPKSNPVVLADNAPPAFQDHNYRRAFYAALGRDWLLTGQCGEGGSLGYRLVHIKTGTRGPGYGAEGPLPLEKVEAFLSGSSVA
jgi:hypothetical protein